MWLQRITHELLSHRWKTVALVFIMSFIPVLGMIAILIAALVTLRKNSVEGGLLMLLATVIVAARFFYFGHLQAIPMLDLYFVTSEIVLRNLFTWVFAVMLARHTSLSVVLQIAALIGVLIVSVVHLVYPEIGEWWRVALQSSYDKAHSIMSVIKSQNAELTEADVINVHKDYATGLVLSGILFYATFQLILARWWQAMVFRPGSLRRELHNIRLSPLAGGLFFAGLVLAYLGNSVVLDIMPILYLLFGVAGLSLIHYLFGLMTSRTKWVWLILFYIMFFLSMPTSLELVSVLALFDIWLNVRKRMTVKE